MSTAASSAGARRLLFVLLTIAGGTLVLGHFGIVPWRAHGRCRAIFCDPYHWQVLSFGIGCLSAGLALVVPTSMPAIGRLCALGAGGGLGAGVLGSLFFA